MLTHGQKYLVFDQDAFLSICHRDQELENSLLSIMSDAVKKETANLEKSVNQRKTKELRQQWHHLKGTLGGLGQQHLCHMIDQMEQCENVFSPSNLLLQSSLMNKLKVLATEMEKFAKMKQKISK